MDRGEQTLVPQWLKGAGRSGGISGSLHHNLPVSQSDGIDGAGNSTLSKYRLSKSETSVRPSLNYSRKENGDHRNFDRDGFGNSRAYASFRQSSSSRVRDSVRKEKDYTKERPFASGLDQYDRDPFDISRRLSGSPPSNRSPSDKILRRTRSVAASAGLENSCGKLGAQSENVSPSTTSQKASFENKFPHLKTVGKQDKEIVMSTVLASCSSSVAFVSRGSSDTWRSALANPPAQAHQGGKPASGLKMTEILLQNTPTVSSPQLLAETQRIEEMTLKQSRQLIPVIPGTAKATGLGLSDGPRTKSFNPTDNSQLTKSNSHHRHGSSSSSSTQGGGRLLILKPVKEAKSPKHVTSIAPYSSASLATGCSRSVGSPNWKNKQVNIALSGTDTETLLRCGNDVVHGGAEEKRVVTSLAAQNRSEFFNSLRKKAANEDNDHSNSKRINNTNNNSNISKSENGTTPLVQEKCNNSNDLELVRIGEVVITATVNSEEKEVGSHDFIVGEAGKGAELCRLKVISEEEEAAFLRLLGWEENAGGEEALTEEEISTFYQEHCGVMNSRNILRQGKKTWNLSTLTTRVGTSD